MLVVDKPAGMTSHDVVAVARRNLRQRRIGHTGTLDPFATGVLPLALGRATRLVRFLSASDKRYLATIRFGLTTDTYDVTGKETGRSAVRPSAPDVLEAIRAVAARTLQLPPPYSAKKIDGQRAYALARQQQAVTLAPVPVQVRTFDVQEITDDDVIVDVTCSAGFYVRSFAHDLGTTLGVGACLERLRRIESGPFTLSQAVTLAQLDAGLPDDAIVSIDNLLPDFPAVVVDEAGRNRFGHGQPLRPGDIREVVPGRSHARPDEGWVRVFHGPALVGLAQRGADAALHPAIVLI